jgi:hypothetical protein
VYGHHRPNSKVKRKPRFPKIESYKATRYPLPVALPERPTAIPRVIDPRAKLRRYCLLSFVVLSINKFGLGIYEHPSTQQSRHVRPERRAAAQPGALYVSVSVSMMLHMSHTMSNTNTTQNLGLEAKLNFFSKKITSVRPPFEHEFWF